MSTTNRTNTELAETREWIIRVCMERYLASGMTEPEARAIVEEAINARSRSRVYMIDELVASDEG